MDFWKRLPIAVQFSVLLAVAVVLGAASAYQIGGTIYVNEARNQARTVADMVENVGTWASQYKGIWVKNDTKDAGFKVGDYLEREVAYPRPAVAASAPAQGAVAKLVATKPAALTQDELDELESALAAYHRKNPALVQRELSDVTQASPSQAKFRMTSDKFMNPNNAPTQFELTAIESLRASKQVEYSEVRGTDLLYARRVIASAACLKCHGTPEQAPLAVRTRYGTTKGFGYQEGEVAGVISVAIPLKYEPQKLVSDFGWKTWLAVVAFCLSALLILLYVQRSIIAPVRKLKAYAEKAAHSELGRDIGKLQFVDDEHGSSNEVHRLSAAIKAMYQSIRLLHRQSRGQQSNVTPL